MFTEGIDGVNFIMYESQSFSQDVTNIVWSMQLYNGVVGDTENRHVSIAEINYCAIVKLHVQGEHRKVAPAAPLTLLIFQKCMQILHNC